MAFLVVDQNWGRTDGQPEIDLELQGHFGTRDREGCAHSIYFSGFATDVGAGQEIGIAFRGFALSQGWHIGRGRSRVKGMRGEGDRLLVNGRGGSLRKLAGR